MPLSRSDRLVMELHLLGVSHKAIIELVGDYPWEVIEDQLKYLPFRNARRPAAFIVKAIKFNYSPPKDYFYAAHQALSASSRQQLDKDAESPIRQPSAEAQGYGTPGALDSGPPNNRVE